MKRNLQVDQSPLAAQYDHRPKIIHSSCCAYLLTIEHPRCLGRRRRARLVLETQTEVARMSSGGMQDHLFCKTFSAWIKSIKCGGTDVASRQIK